MLVLDGSHWLEGFQRLDRPLRRRKGITYRFSFEQ